MNDGEEIVDYYGHTAPRHQVCAFCHEQYDALLGPMRPHGVCDDCWPEICAAERKHAAENPIVRERRDYVLEWSQSQACFHIQTIDEATRRNRNAFADNRQCDWVILLENKTHRECSDAASLLKESRGPAGQAYRKKVEGMFKL
jgi:hypothetical protein